MICRLLLPPLVSTCLAVLHLFIYSLTSLLLAKTRTEGGEVDVSNVSGRPRGLGFHQGLADNSGCLLEWLRVAWNIQSLASPLYLLPFLLLMTDQKKKGNLRSRRYSPCPPPSSLGNGPTQDTLSTRSRSLSFTKTLPSQVLRNVRNQHISPHVYCPLVTLIKQTAFRCIFQPNFPDTRRESRASTEASSGGGYRQPTVTRNACLPVVTTTRDKRMKLSISEAAVVVLLASTAPTKPQRERERKSLQ